MLTIGPIFRREVIRQLASPSSWLIVGLFAVLSGAAFMTSLNLFLDQTSLALTTPPPEPVNINQLLVRPFMVRLGMAALVVLPLLTARAWAPERPAGSVRAVLATFTGTLAVYLIMLLVSAMPMAVLFLFGAPEWGSLATGYAGLLLAGAAFISVGLFLSSLSTSAVAAACATAALSAMLAAVAWLARSGTAGAQPVFGHFSAGDALDDFAKGIIDTGHVVTCLSITALCIFLTGRALQRPVERRQPATGH